MALLLDLLWENGLLQNLLRGPGSGVERPSEAAPQLRPVGGR
jgi:hypothetical protein